MTEQQMPTRIWTYRISNFTEGYWRTKRAASKDTCYVRADLAQGMAEALAQCAEARMPGEARRIARESLSAFRSATRDTEARHD